MPAAKPPLLPLTSASPSDEEIASIKQAVHHFYGDAAVVRNFGADSKYLRLHVEADREAVNDRWDCLSVLFTRINRRIELVITKRGAKIEGEAKIAYRQGVVL